MVLIGLTAHVFPHIKQWTEKAVYGSWKDEIESITEVGGVPVLIPAILEPEDVERMVNRLDGILFAGGGDIDASFYDSRNAEWFENVHTERDRMEFALARAAIANDKPLLAICRGIQLLNVALEGTLIPDIGKTIHDGLQHRIKPGSPGILAEHAITLEAESKLEKIFHSRHLRVNSAHHQAIDKPGKGLVVTSRSADGIIEGVELPGHPFCIGVQWHPEVKNGNHESMKPLFEAFIEAARKEE